MGCLIFHNWQKVDAEVAKAAGCSRCFTTDHKNGAAVCSMSIRVCRDCGKAESYGHGGRSSIIPGNCQKAVFHMRGLVGR
jgi:hypothetical protein